MPDVGVCVGSSAWTAVRRGIGGKKCSLSDARRGGQMCALTYRQTDVACSADVTSEEPLFSSTKRTYLSQAHLGKINLGPIRSSRLPGLFFEFDCFGDR